jgi:hypothetical protein
MATDATAAGWMSLGTQVGAEAQSMIANVQRDAAAGDTQAISVDLSVLEGFYRQLWDLHDHIEALIASTTDKNAEALGIVEGIDAGAGQRHIAGVVSAVQRARHIATGQTHGLREVLGSVRNQIDKNLRALYDCYEAYNTTDLDGKDQLDGALAKIANAHYR